MIKNWREQVSANKITNQRTVGNRFSLLRHTAECNRQILGNSLTSSNINENNEKIINNEHEISKLIKALPKDIAALDKRSVLANVNSQGSGT